ncbi:hypothetical protein O3P69_011008 [Scylla paramamosain]|uniref:Uncharacterized protein n=1 Tax=Scylla paramamosain TaxID=85552 RepID=A0AAW0SDD9_SCYPA
MPAWPRLLPDWRAAPPTAGKDKGLIGSKAGAGRVWERRPAPPTNIMAGGGCSSQGLLPHCGVKGEVDRR